MRQWTFGDLQVVRRIPRRTNGEEIVIGHNVFRGKEYVTIRIFAPGEDGALLPTKKGITFNAELRATRADPRRPPGD